MNVLLNILSNYKYEIAEWLSKNMWAENVYIPYIPSLYDENDEIELGKTTHFWPLEEMMRLGIENMAVSEECPPLDGDFIENARVYESMFIHCDCQPASVPVQMYHECKRRYYLYLRYWKTFYEKHSIKYVIYDDIPHWPALYASYIVARLLSIKTTILAPVGMRAPGIDGYVCLYGHTLETIGEPVRAYYNLMKSEDDVELSGLVEAYFEKSVKKNNEAIIKPASRKQWMKYVRNAKYSTPNLACPGLYAFVKNCSYVAGAIIKHHSVKEYYKKKYDQKKIRDLKRFHIFHEYDSFSLEEYDKMAEMPDFNERYILFPVQLWPEATTTPQAGVFAEQYNAIQLVAYVAKEYGIKVYVKDYYLQPYRCKLFWEELKNIDNVVFIKSNYSSGELMEHALAVANQTGTCLMEAPFYGVPSIAVGKGYCFKGMPGLFEVNNRDQGKAAVEEIISGEIIDKVELKKYYYAIQQNSVFFHRDPLGKIRIGSEEYKQTERELKKFLEKELTNYAE